MKNKIDLALSKLYIRDISAREELLREMLRAKITNRELSNLSNPSEDKETVFQIMKRETEDTLGFFPADRDDFYDIYISFKEIDPINFVIEVYKNDRMGIVVSPIYLSLYINENLKKNNYKNILITEAEKHLTGLKEIIVENEDKLFTLTTQNNLMKMFLDFIFFEKNNVKVIFESIYLNLIDETKYDYIFSLPIFGQKQESNFKNFKTMDSDGIALENMLKHLDSNGTLDIILPAKITFASQGYSDLRSYIKEKFNINKIFIIPEGTFRPFTSIKTYFFSITRKQKNIVNIGEFKLDKDTFFEKTIKKISTQEFLLYNDWRIELLLSDDDANIQKFKSSTLEKVKLKDVSEVFRGKSILKKDTTVGKIGILNISNIERGEIDYSDMDTIEEDERKVKRYELEDGDVVLSCRGTAIKTAVFKRQDKTIIASANLIVIRPKENILGDYIKIFFESPIGMAIIKSFQRGTTIMNINHSDIMEMEIPLLAIEKQQEMIQLYNQELNTYKKTVQEAETKWNSVKEQLYNNLI